MKFNFKKFNSIVDTNIELSDLTILCGLNNSGKTRVSHTIYELVENFSHISRIVFPSVDFIDDLITKGKIVLDLSVLKSLISEKFNDISKIYNEFSGNSVSLIDCCQLNTIEFKGVTLIDDVNTLKIKKFLGNDFLSIEFDIINLTSSKQSIVSYIDNVISDLLFSKVYKSPFIMTNERVGIATFYKYIVSKVSSDENDIYIDNIDSINYYKSDLKSSSLFSKNRQWYAFIFNSLRNLVGGTFRVIDKDIFFIPNRSKGENENKILLEKSPSSVKSLFLLDFFINSVAEDNSLLIINNPELNLFPDKQIAIARLLALLVNNGIKVIITTNSDFIIKEFNNCVMLSNRVYDKAERSSLMKRYKFKKDSILNPRQIRAYTLVSKSEIVESNVDEYGVNIHIFDNIIADTNLFSDSIYYNIND